MGCAAFPAIDSFELLAIVDVATFGDPYRDERLVGRDACHSRRRKETAASGSVDPHALRWSLKPLVDVKKPHCCHSWRCRCSAAGSSHAQPLQMPLRNCCTEMFRDEIGGILGSCNFGQLHVVSFQLILQPQITYIEMAKLAESCASHNPYGRACVGVDCGICLCSQVR